KGIPAPHAEPIRVENGKPILDEFGNVTGGVRSPFVDVPASTWSGASTGQSFCFIAGHEKPFDASRIKQLYPDHKTYERKIQAIRSHRHRNAARVRRGDRRGTVPASHSCSFLTT